MNYKNFKAGYVAIIGRPNAGKSTLLNSILDIKLSIVSYKPQTTRKRVLGILNEENLQVVFMDTPGMILPKYELQSQLMTYVGQSVSEADLIIAMFSMDKYHGKIQDFKHELEYIRQIKLPVLAVINKTDTVSKDQILPLIDQLAGTELFQAIIPISALKNDGIDTLKEEFSALLPYHPPFYDQETLTEHPERFFASEIIRESIFHYYKDEIPYSTEVFIDEFKERNQGKDYIRATIMVERDSQKQILIGKNGAALKKVGSNARKQLEKFLDRGVFLEIFVKVNPNWRNDKKKLKWLGY
jgi:GTP-binding protein Era